jgi:hypothetical protein
MAILESPILSFKIGHLGQDAGHDSIAGGNRQLTES